MSVFIVCGSPTYVYTHPHPSDQYLYPHSPNSLPASSPGPSRLQVLPIRHEQNHPYGNNVAFPSFHQQQPIDEGFFWPASQGGPPSTYDPLFRSISFPPLKINPYLDADSPYRLIFDFSKPRFSPIQCIGPDKFVRCSMEELNKFATQPRITRLRIICDFSFIQQSWPIDLTYYDPTGITVYDIMVEVWRNLRVGVSHEDWAKFSTAEQTEVARAYTRRYKNAASHDQEMLIESEGVKMVDFLLGKVWFAGLRTIGESYEQMQLVVEEA